MQGPGSLAMDKEDINQVGDQFSHLIRHVNDQGGGDAPCPIVFGELQLGVRRRRKEEGEEESQVADEEEKEERELGKGSQREGERRSSNNSTSGRFSHSKFRETSLIVFEEYLNG